MDEGNLPILHIQRAKKNPLPQQGDSLPGLTIQRKRKPSHKKQSFTTNAPAYQEQERYQPAQGQSRLGRDMQTGEYVDVAQAARRQGLYVIGATGTGKSGLIENLIIQDIKQGLGVGLLDPHGDLTNAVLSRLPDTRVVDGVKRKTEEDVILLDIKNTQYPFGLNLFSCLDPSDLVALTIASAHVMHIFRKLWGKGGILVEDAWGVLLEKILENATLTLLENPGYTMAEIPLLLDVYNPSFRKKLIQNLMSDTVRDFWEHDFATLPSKDQRQEIQSTLNRVNSFLRQQLVRNIIGQSRTTIDFRSIMDERKILLVRLNVRLGEGITTLLGTMILAGILDAAYSRADLPVNKRKQFNLYADEFQRFASEDFATLLTEARKYGIATTIAHQMRNQLDTQNGGATLNVANLVVFKISGADATELAGEFDITPQEAWEEELEEERVEVLRPQRHERKEEQVEVEVEQDIEEISQNPVDYLVGARGTHVSKKVRRITQDYLVSLTADEGRTENMKMKQEKMLLNQLLVAVMEGRIQMETEAFTEAVIQVMSVHFDRFYLLNWGNTPGYDWGSQAPGFIRMLVLGTPDATTEAERIGRIASLSEKAHIMEAHRRYLYSSKSEVQQRWGTIYDPSCGPRHMTYEETRERFGDIIERECEEKANRSANIEGAKKWAENQALQCASLVSLLLGLCEELAINPIRVPTGQKRMVKRIQPHITYLTHESEKITHPRIAIMHPQRSYADMLNEVASQLANLPAFTARAKIATEGKPIEHTIRTLEPERGLDRTALQERVERIQARNRDDGYIRLRQDVEAEIRTRQNQWREPPEPPPITRRHQ